MIMKFEVTIETDTASPEEVKEAIEDSLIVLELRGGFILSAKTVKVECLEG
jgi:hypothetical protein